MDLVLTDVSIITGDGHTHNPLGYVAITDGHIADLAPGAYTGKISEGVTILDGGGTTVIPGVVNAHAHGCTDGPAMPSGSRSFSPIAVRYERNRHLLGGTTTLVNVCGLGLPTEVDLHSSRHHPLQIHVATSHTPASIAAALAVDGEGLSDRHRMSNVDEAVRQGAIALGEGGGGQTLGGGAQDYSFIPRAIKRATGITISPKEARELKETLLGRNLESNIAKLSSDFIELCDRIGLLKQANARHIASAIWNTVMPPVAKARQGLRELVTEASRTGLPVLLHTAMPSASQIIELARVFPRAQLIAAHCNHPSFTPEEAVSTATRLRALGVAIEVCTLDTISTRWRNSSDNLDALIEAGLVDTISTDFAGGHWDGILEAVHRMVILGQLSAPAAVALATGNVAKLFPAFSDRGVLEVGKRADIAIVDSKNLGRVRHVVIGGKIVVRDGAIVV